MKHALDIVNAHFMRHHTVRTRGGDNIDLLWQYQEQVPALECTDGFKMSVQASETHYCHPRKNLGIPYTQVEVGFPNKEEPALMPYAELPDNPLGTVYGYVPIGVVLRVIRKHGGLAK